MYKTPARADDSPPHPGEILREDILPCLPFAASELARRLAVSRYDLEALLEERRPVSVDLAQRLGVALGQGAHYWIGLQAQYDLWLALQNRPDGVAPIVWQKTPSKRSATPLRRTAS
jgi:antitoxin HigA-1